jgi:hypothetical protein
MFFRQTSKKSEKTERMRSMKLLQGIRTLVLAGILTMAGTSGVLAEYTAWQDTDYDFSQVKTVYLSDMDMSGYRLTSGTKAQKMLQDYRKKAGKVKGVKVLLAPAVQVRALLPGEEKKQAPEGAGIGAGPEKNGEIQSAAKGERKAAVIPQEALDAGAQLYILATLDNCQVDSYLVPAHTEWRTKEIDDSYRNDQGNWHTYYRTVTYPDYIPDYYVPYASVTVRFLWFDTKTGKLVASSEDARVRDSENDPLGVYNRIIDRFFKNLKETVKK